MTKYSLAIALVSSFIASTGLSSTGLAEADSIRLHASICSIDPSSSSDQIEFASGGRLTNTTGSNQDYICPFTSFTGLQHSNVTSLAIDVRDSSTTGGIGARACYTDYNGTGGACGTSDTACGTSSASATCGYDNLRPSRTQWSTRAFDYPYVSLDVGDDTYIHGIFASTP